MRIAIVNDVALAREALRRVVQSRPGYSIAWVAEDGEQAVRMAQADRPDVILMDLIMPGMDGVEATRRIMASNPCPILVVTATVAGNYSLVLQAMNHGSIDAVHTPEISLDGKFQRDQELLARLERLEREKKSPSSARIRRPILAASATKSTLPPLVALGASTGGPEAIARILERLPTGLRAPVVVVQHISAEFAPNLITWLRGRSKLAVEAARDGHVPPLGVVSVAVTNDHLVLTANHRFQYVKEPIDEPFRPSIDVLFDSLASHWHVPGVAVLLTGMRDDGAMGLSHLRQAGWLTIAQDEATSVVFSMPRAAIELNAACRVMPIHEIAGAIVKRLDGSASTGGGSPK